MEPAPGKSLPLLGKVESTLVARKRVSGFWRYWKALAYLR